ncbi:MAG: HAMP domain-containing histidine kinase, partial [bacterium]|nr:HAMP domain-containing histidine kinase [bacterium]
LLKVVGLDKLKKKSYIVAKLNIRSTVFGILLLAKHEADYYKKADLEVLEAATSILSYVLKDVELSNVFKMQLKALKDGIVEKNEAYKTIKEQNEKILEADKVKNEFLANISHELRTPLNSILGFSEILGTKLYGDLNSKQEEYITDIKVSATHLLGMINEVLDMSKLEANAMKIVKSTFWISRAVDEVCNIISPLAEKKNITVTKNLDVDFEVFADYQKIQQILYNLTSNAIKFTPENGQVDITAKIDNDNFKLIVHDNGCGIEKKYHGKIFAKFVQLDSAYTKKESSTGLGLTITKELVELHNGKISVLSEVNNGSTFVVEIPM